MTTSIYDSSEYAAMLNRIDQLTIESQPLWGKMNVAQMFAHCAEVQEVMNGKKLKNTPLVARLFRKMIRKAVLNAKPYGKNTATHPQYAVAKEVDFSASKSRFLDALKQAYESSEEQIESTDHALFGKMSRQEKGWAAFKHHDHHLRQFGV